MTIFRSSITLAMLAAFAWTGPASANALRQMDRAEKLAAADLVAIVIPIDCAPLGPRQSDDGPCTVSVIETIKGEPASNVTFNRLTLVAEESVNCCDPGHAYLVYLKRGKGQWWSVNGTHGVRDLGPMERRK